MPCAGSGPGGIEPVFPPSLGSTIGAPVYASSGAAGAGAYGASALGVGMGLREAEDEIRTVGGWVGGGAAMALETQ